MNTGNLDNDHTIKGSIESSQPAAVLQPWWNFIAATLLAAIFSQSIFAGLILSGYGWALRAHTITAMALNVSMLAAAVFALVALRRVPNGMKFSLMLLALAALLIIQTVVGKFVSKGANLLWVHIPLGVTLVILALCAAATARKLGR